MQCSVVLLLVAALLLATTGRTHAATHPLFRIWGVCNTAESPAGGLCRQEPAASAAASTVGIASSGSPRVPQQLPVDMRLPCINNASACDLVSNLQSILTACFS
jgi:hypothetical protein